MQYSCGTTFLNLLPDSCLREARHASAFIKAPARCGGDGRPGLLEFGDSRRRHTATNSVQKERRQS